MKQTREKKIELAAKNVIRKRDAWVDGEHEAAFWKSIQRLRKVLKSK